MAGPGLIDSDAINLDRGTNEDIEAGDDNVADAGASIGDLGMDSDSDRYGTGEHLTAGQEPGIAPDGDIDVDQIVSADQAGVGYGLDEAEQAEVDPVHKKR